MQNNQNAPFTEKRRHKRHPLDTQVGILDRGAFSFETSVEISEGGMQLKTFKPLAVGERIEIRFFLPFGPFVSATCEVVYNYEPHLRQYYAGLRFVEIAPELVSSIRTYGETR